MDLSGLDDGSVSLLESKLDAAMAEVRIAQAFLHIAGDGKTLQSAAGEALHQLQTASTAVGEVESALEESSPPGSPKAGASPVPSSPSGPEESRELSSRAVVRRKVDKARLSLEAALAAVRAEVGSLEKQEKAAEGGRGEPTPPVLEQERPRGRTTFF